MKKIFTLLIGIVFLISCKGNNDAIDATKAMKRVTIYLRSVEINGKKHLAMYDSNNNWAIDTLTTKVKVGGTVLWKLERCSNIRKITEISFVTGKLNVFDREPKKRLFGKGYKLKISTDEEKRGEEKYFIKYLDLNHNEEEIDPHIRVEI